MNIPEITPNIVIKSITSSKNSVTVTPDGVPAIYLKNTSTQLSEPLANLYNLTLSQQQVPDLWKQAYVRALYKNRGIKSNPESSRPISMTSEICKGLERIICDCILTHLEKNNLLSIHQHGFVKNRSTLSQHLSLLNHLTQNYDNNIQSEIIYLDYSKAFDSVPHNKLIYVLEHLHINKSVISWIKDYLKDRTQRVIVDGWYSDPCKFIIVFPQGTVIAPHIFRIYTDDLLQILTKQSHIKFYAFADDLKISSTNHTNLQNSLDIVGTWSKLWQLKIQPTKSEHIIFEPHKRNQTTSTTYYLDNKPIPKTNTVRDLGILITSDLKWETQTRKIYSKALVLVYTILRSFKTTKPRSYVQMFKTYIRPIIEYNHIM